MTDELTPAQKAAITRAANKEKRAAEAALEKATEAVDAFEDSPELITLVQEELVDKIPAKYRGAIYVSGAVIGAIVLVTQAVAAVTTGEVQALTNAAAGLLLSITNLLARFNLSKPVAATIEVDAVG